MVTKLPSRNGAEVPVVYAMGWDDDFGVRGWKLDLAGMGRDVIAATPDTGERIPTSVFVHDILDHYLCGFALSGYCDEAGALIQLARRTGSDPLPDFGQIIDEDLLPGAFETPDWRALLPDSLVASVEAAPDLRTGMAHLRSEWGDGVVRSLFVAGFVRRGWEQAPGARRVWESRGLDYASRPAMGLALQELFQRIDARVTTGRWVEARGTFVLEPDRVAFRFDHPSSVADERVPVASAASGAN